MAAVHALSLCLATFVHAHIARTAEPSLMYTVALAMRKNSTRRVRWAR